MDKLTEKYWSFGKVPRFDTPEYALWRGSLDRVGIGEQQTQVFRAMVAIDPNDPNRHADALQNGARL